jgi:hypothetical protein
MSLKLVRPDLEETLGFSVLSQNALEQVEGAFIISHGEAQSRDGRVCDCELALDEWVLGFLVCRLEYIDGMHHEAIFDQTRDIRPRS